MQLYDHPNEKISEERRREEKRGDNEQRRSEMRQVSREGDIADLNTGWWKGKEPQSQQICNKSKQLKTASVF